MQSLPPCSISVLHSAGAITGSGGFGRNRRRRCPFGFRQQEHDRQHELCANLSEEAAQGGSGASQDATPGDDDAETPPPVGNFEPLNLSQLRYCKFQERRLELLKDQVPQSAYPQFNGSVDDWNSRCNNSQFLHSYGVTIDGELARSEPQIQAEVARTLRQWTPVPVLTPPQSSSSEEQPDDSLSTWQPPASDPVDTSADDENSGD
jgi:hypothetical protein